MDFDEETRKELLIFCESCSSCIFENDTTAKSLYQISLNVQSLKERLKL